MIAVEIIADTLPIRELPPTFTLQICRQGGHFEGTVTNHDAFKATLHYLDIHCIDEIPHTEDQRTYDFLLWPDSYILIEYRDKSYKLDMKSAEEEVQG